MELSLVQFLFLLIIIWCVCRHIGHAETNTLMKKINDLTLSPLR
jgi:hypothetical protein